VKILVTGGTGLVGNNCIRLLHVEHELHAMVRDGYDKRPFEGLNVTFCLGDLSRPDALANCIPEVDVIIHSAGDTHIGKQPRPSQHVVNTIATRAIADIARQRNVKMIFVSSVDALPAGSIENLVDEETPGAAKCPIGYVLTKREAEADLLEQIENGLDAVIVNPGFMLGPWDWKPSSGRMLLDVATKVTPLAPSGGFSVCDVREVAASICYTATKTTAHRRYILAGHNITYLDAWKIFAKVSGGSPPIGSAGPITLNAAGRWGDVIAKLSGREGDVNSGTIAMSMLYHYYDSSRAERELGYRLRPVEESAADAWAWFCDHGYAKSRSTGTKNS